MTVDTTVPRSRRALLAAAAGGLAALAGAALGRPDRANAAAGDNLVLGQTNDSGTAQTVLNNAGLGAAFTLRTTNVSTNAAGIFGWTSSTLGFATKGVYGKAEGPNSYGVFGRNSGAPGSGAAIYAEGYQNDGLVGTSSSADRYGVKGLGPGTGVYGEATASYNGVAGVYGVTAGEQSYSAGVIGFAAAGNAAGVRGLAPRTGVYGEATAGQVETFGVHGVGSNGVRGEGYVAGVYGDSQNGVGVRGSSSSSWGVYGTSSSSYAGYFGGPVYVSGLLTKAGGGFKIDHPLDPGKKYLTHSFVESPDMKNVYDGVVALDAKGEATVRLPSYFEALNRDTRIQLTAVGAAAPDLHVKSKVAKGGFRIAGGTAGQEVFWQVTGIRQDAFAEAHRIVVEEAKPAAERGLYIHPDLYGQPDAKGLEYRHRVRELRPAS